MEAIKQTYKWEADVTERPIIDPNWRNQPDCSKEEFMNKLAQRLGQHYGLADIRDAK